MLHASELHASELGLISTGIGIDGREWTVVM